MVLIPYSDVGSIINIERDIMITFDRQKGLTKAVELMLLNAHHSYYLRHLVRNL